MTNPFAPKAPLGVGTLISTGFRVFLGNFMPFFLTVLLLNLILIATQLAMRVDAPEGLSNEEIALLQFEQGFGPLIFQMIVGVMVLAVMAIATSRMAADAAAGRPVRALWVFAGMGRTLAPMIVLGLAAWSLVMIAMALFILPGLWLAAALFVTAPAVAIGDAGFDGLRRSWGLTKGYRWPILGLMVLLAVILSLMSSAAILAQAVVLGASGHAEYVTASMTPGIAQTVVNAAIFGLVYPIGFIIPALTYLRLVDIKEGGADPDLAKVFA